MSLEECIACASAYTDCVRIKTICNNCKFECCKQCVSRNIKSNGFHCAMCKKEYCPSFIGNIFSKQFIKKFYITSMKDKIFDRELKLIPMTTKKNLIQKKKKEILKLMEEAIISIGEQVKPIFEEKLLNVSSSCFKDCFYPNCDGIMYKDSDEKYFKCNICNNYGCVKCEISCKDVELHLCDENKIKEVEAIRKDTKPCPNCGTSIFKADGCSQIMCSKCKTFFDFNTGLQDKEDEPKHARDYIDMPYKFEKKIIEEYKFEEFESKIRVCKDWDLWEKDIAKNKYSKVIHNNIIIKSACASIINSKNYIRKMLSEHVDIENMNETNRIKYIEDIQSKSNIDIKDKKKVISIFKTESVKRHFDYYCDIYIMIQCTQYFFELKKILHKYVQMYSKCKETQITKIKEKEEQKCLDLIKDLQTKTGEYLTTFSSKKICIDSFRYSSIV
jgi:hypothetical protein